MYMISLIWGESESEDVTGHNICIVKKLPDPHVTKWMLKEMQISYQDKGIIKGGNLIAQNKSKTVLWFARPDNYEWEKARIKPSD